MYCCNLVLQHLTKSRKFVFILKMYKISKFYSQGRQLKSKFAISPCRNLTISKVYTHIFL